MNEELEDIGKPSLLELSNEGLVSIIEEAGQNPTVPPRLKLASGVTTSFEK